MASRTDHYPVVKAEGVAMDLARRVGLDVARVETTTSLGKDVLLVERFDSDTALNDQYFSQSTPGVPGTSRPYDGFGATTALGDLNGDGCADLAIGAPGAALTGDINWDGTVTILYGSKSGLTTSGAQRFTSEQVFGSPDGNFDGFGSATALADFDHDGIADLAVGAPGRATSSRPVAVMFGASDGLTHDRSTEFLSPAATVSGISSLAAGDFDGNGRIELAIGSADALTTVERVEGGYASATPRVLPKSSLHVPNDNDTDAFGGVLAAGDVNADGTSDLAIGVPQRGCDEDEPEDCGAGAVLLVPGSPTGLVAERRQLWTQDTAGMSGVALDLDGFGAALAMGRFDAGATDDLAIGAPYDWVGSKRSVGTVTLLLGSTSGLTTAGVGGSRSTRTAPAFPAPRKKVRNSVGYWPLPRSNRAVRTTW